MALRLVAGGVGPEDAGGDRAGGDAVYGAGAIPGATAEPAYGVIDDVHPLGHDPVHALGVLDVSVEVHQVELGVRRHLMDDLRDAGAVNLAAAGDVAVGAAGVSDHRGGEFSTQEAGIPREPQVQDSHFDAAAGEAGGVPDVGVDEGHALARDQGEALVGEADEPNVRTGGQVLQGGDRHQRLYQVAADLLHPPVQGRDGAHRLRRPARLGLDDDAHLAVMEGQGPLQAAWAAAGNPPVPKASATCARVLSSLASGPPSAAATGASGNKSPTSSVSLSPGLGESKISLPVRATARTATSMTRPATRFIRQDL